MSEQHKQAEKQHEKQDRPIGLTAAVRQIGANQLDPKNLLKQSFELANQLEPKLKAFVSRNSLEDLIKAVTPGPLSGIPVGIKDIINTQDLPTTNGSVIYANHHPSQDAPIVQKIRSLGGVIFGKTVTTQFAWKTPGPTVNPWNSAHTPGGSSSGSAAAVAAGIVPLALGTQTVGSVVRPAAFCGVVGFKPSFGAISKEGAHPLSYSLDHIGFFTRSVDDVAYAYQLLKEGGAETSADTVTTLINLQLEHAPKIALIKTPFDHLMSAEQQQTIQLAVQKLEHAGASVKTIELSAQYWDGVNQMPTIMSYEAAQIHREHLEKHQALLCENIKELATKGAEYTQAQYDAALAQQAKLRKSVSEVFKDFDALLTAPATGEAPNDLTWTGDPSFCALGSYLGIPAINLPAGMSVNGLPLGIQLMGNYKEDEALLKVAKFAEQSLSS
ncbi:amidase [Polynucleobacter wuianus]|uniref:amidase n=1 Tax=Polynucleobacter wuianus TaxID=1743168 RepID=UPI001C0AD635|nr:amidase [Polynucleobacter wuianus]MBU3609552.1 amidase [Polynucleobacter wuianus]